MEKQRQGSGLGLPQEGVLLHLPVGQGGIEWSNDQMGHRHPSDTPLLPLQLIQAGKGEALRIRAILRSLVPLDDLVGIISLPLQIPTLGKGVEGQDSAKD